MTLEKLHRNGTVQKVQEKVSSKPVLGKPLGSYELTFRYLDGTAVKFEGEVSDVTGLFIGSKIQADFKRVIFEEAKRMGIGTAENADDKNAGALAVALWYFKDYDFSTTCRVLLLEEPVNHQKHLILQVRNIDLLTEYATNLDRAQWSFLRGLKYDFLADGRASTFPHKKRLRGLDEVFIHVFIPEDRSGSDEQDGKDLANAQNLSEIVPIIPQTVDIEQYLKAKDDELTSKDGALKKARGDLSEKATRNEAANIAVAGLEGDGEPPVSSIKKVDFVDFLLIALPWAVTTAFGNSLGPNGWLAGFIGLGVGFGLVTWRK